MTKDQAEFWVEILTNLLADKNLTSVFVSPLSGVEIRCNQKFEKSYFVEHQNGSCSVALCDTYGVFTGAKDWEIDPDKRTVHARTLNGYGELIQNSWAIADDTDGLWSEMKKAQKESWQFPYIKVEERK